MANKLKPFVSAFKIARAFYTGRSGSTACNNTFWSDVRSKKCYIITLRIQALSLVESHDLSEGRSGARNYVTIIKVASRSPLFV